jgi:hypothetical protein
VLLLDEHLQSVVQHRSAHQIIIKSSDIHA